eukprot:gene24482-29591_t
MLAITGFIVLASLLTCEAFRMHSGYLKQKPRAGVQSLSAMLDVMAGAALALHLSTSPISAPPTHHFPLTSSLPVAVIETRQGIYKEYTVEKSDSNAAALDNVSRGYKTAEETEESKNK